MNSSKTKTALEADASLLALEKMELFHRKFMQFYKVEDPQADLYDWGNWGKDGEWAVSFMPINILQDNYFIVYYSTVKGFRIHNENLLPKDEVDHDVEADHTRWAHATHDPDVFLTSVDIYLMNRYRKAEEDLIRFRKVLQDSRQIKLLHYPHPILYMGLRPMDHQGDEGEK
jgi:hypothetical protein